MCRIFAVSRSGYYSYVRRMDIPARDLPLAENIRECQAECRSTYGCRRVHIWLERNGIHRNPKTVPRVMNKYNLLSVIRRKRYVKYGDALHRYLNLLNRNFLPAGQTRNGWQSFLTSEASKGSCILLASVISMATALLRIRSTQSKVASWRWIPFAIPYSGGSFALSA